MNKVKVRFITIFALCAALLASLVLGAWAAFGAPVGAYAADGDVNYAPSSVFAAGSGGTVGASEGEGDKFVQFSFTDGGNVHFRRDLAYKWFEAADPADPADSAQTELANPGVARYFSMEFAFASGDFELFTVSFESGEENVSKEGKSVNSILFRPAEDGNSIEAAVKNASEQETENDKLSWSKVNASVTDVIAVSFEEGQNVGEFSVTVGTSSESLNGDFTNIGGNYAEYRSSSSSTPNTPITFTMDFAEETEAENVKVLMHSLNGQSFKLDADGKVVDNVAPVLAVNEGVYAFRLGQRYNFTSYEAIDVCDSSVTVSRYYYMAKKTGTGTYEIADEGEESSYKSLTTSTFFLPAQSTADALGDEYVSVRFELDDGRDNSEGQYVYLTWYAADTSEEGGIVKTLSSAADDTDSAQSWDFIVVSPDDREGPAYTGVTLDESGKTNTTEQAYTDAVKVYQSDVTEAAENTSAGTGAYLYLPSLRGLIKSSYADYRDLSFSVYYWHESQEVGSAPSSETSLSYNNLRFEVDKEGKYTFRIIAEDSAGAAMEMYDKNGELVELSSDTVGYDDDGEEFLIAEIPTFSVSIGYTGASIEDPGSQDYGYRDRNYSVDDFEVIALEGYASDYSLYYFDRSELENAPTYSDCVNDARSVFTQYAENLRLINVYNDDVSEDDEEWDDTDNAYDWDPESSLSFTPQLSGVYFVELTVTEQSGATVTSYMAVDIRNPVDVIPGVSQWLQNNTVSVVLFAVSGVLAVIIIVLFVVKPSEKTVEEVDLEKLKGRKNRKN